MRAGSSGLSFPVTQKRWLLALCVTASAVGAGLWWTGAAGGAQETTLPAPGRVATAERREFVRVIRLTGLTEATRSYVVTTPLLTGANRGSLVVTKLAKAGSSVRAGDVLVEFDRQTEENTALEKRAEYDDLVQQMAQKQAEHDAARVKDESELEQAGNAVKKFELEVLKNEMLSRILAEKNDQDLAEARARLAMLQEGFALKREAARAELRILEIRRDRARAAMEHAVDNAHAMTVRSPLEGLVVPKLTWRGNGPAEIQEGDELWPGRPVLEVVNPASMQVRAKVNQADAPFIRRGQTVTVRLDAYPDFRMRGTIAQVAPIAVAGSFSQRVRQFGAVISIEGSQSRLLPDLTAAIDVEVERVSDAVVIPRDAVFREGDATRVRVRDGAGTVNRDVTLGPADEVSVVVLDGVRTGEVVLR